MKKIIKSDKFTYSWMVLCNTAFGWTAQFKNESLKTIVICSIVFLSAAVYGWISRSENTSANVKDKKDNPKPKPIKRPEPGQPRKNVPKYS